MKYILQKDYRLRGWKGEPFWLEYFPDRSRRKLSPEAFAFFLRCDGLTELSRDEWPREPEGAVRDGIIREAEEGSVLLPEQEYFLYPNRKTDDLHLSLTGRCNFNCRHCFNASDTHPRTVEPDMDQLVALLDQMDSCGVGRVRLDGGEPLTRPDFLLITAELARRGIRLRELMTNGWLVTPELVDELEAQGHRPAWCVSFDGLGCHEWLRRVEGSEKVVLRAIRLLCDRGCEVRVHQCVWKDSRTSVRPTVLKLQEMGVTRYRITVVEPSLRWKELAAGQTISPEEWLALIPDFLEWWYRNRINMDLNLWGYWLHLRGTDRVHILPDLCSRGMDDSLPACPTHRRMPFIDADGRLVPCMALSGITDAMGEDWGNVYREDRLQEILTDSPFFRQICTTCGELKAGNPECRECAWRGQCAAGCRAEALAQGNGLNGPDRRMCLFFRNGTYDRLLAIAHQFGFRTQD